MECGVGQTCHSTEEPLKIFVFHIPRKQNKQAIATEGRLLQYWQFPDKNTRGTSRDIWIFSRYFEVFIYSTISRGTLVIWTVRTEVSVAYFNAIAARDSSKTTTRRNHDRRFSESVSHINRWKGLLTSEDGNDHFYHIPSNCKSPEFAFPQQSTTQ
jgi:hypothetical protein